MLLRLGLQAGSALRVGRGRLLFPLHLRSVWAVSLSDMGARKAKHRIRIERNCPCK